MLKKIGLAGVVVVLGAAGMVLRSAANPQGNAQQRQAPTERRLPNITLAPKNPADLPETTFVCPAETDYKLERFNGDWVAPMAQAFLLKAEVSEKYHPGKQSLICSYNMDGLGKFTWFIYKDVPLRSCQVSADQKSFVCRM